MAGNASKRTWVVEQGIERAPDGSLVLGTTFDMERAEELLARLLQTLAEVGGMVSIATDRVRAGEFNGEPLAESRRLIVSWQAFSPLRDDDDGDYEPALADTEPPEGEHFTTSSPEFTAPDVEPQVPPSYGPDVESSEPQAEPDDARDEWAAELEAQGVDTDGLEVEETHYRIGAPAGGAE